MTEIADEFRRSILRKEFHMDVLNCDPMSFDKKCELTFVCLRPDGCLELPNTLSLVCRSVSNKLDGLDGFHFHRLRHTYTSNLLSNGSFVGCG